MNNLNKNLIFKYELAFEKIKEASNILLVAHGRPDGDALSAIGSFISLFGLINKSYIAFCEGEFSQSLSYIPNCYKIINDKTKFNFSKIDLIIVLDCGAISRTGIKNEILGRDKNQYLIEFDHHPKIDDYADLEFRNPKAVSTTEIIYDFFKTNKLPITKDVATCILAGILTDTFNFAHQCTSEKSLKIASEMIESGAYMPSITNKTYYNKNISSMKIFGVVLSRLKINKKYNLAYTYLAKEEMSKISNDDHIFDAIAGFLNSLADVYGVIFLREERNRDTGEVFIKGSIRSPHQKADISKLAKAMGGGGHKKAAAFRINGELKECDGKLLVV